MRVIPNADCWITDPAHIAQIQGVYDQSHQWIGKRIYDLAQAFHYPLPANPQHAKGWMGALWEKALGTQAPCQPMPDFPSCGLEVKTLPIQASHRVQGSTYITACPVTWQAWTQPWAETPLAHKLQRIIWIPLIDRGLGPLCRVIGPAFLTDFSGPIAETIVQDWEAISEAFTFGGIESITATLGVYLQVRPKAAHGRVTTQGTNQQGQSQRTMPRGFYVRPRCTQQLYDAARQLVP